MSQPWLSPERRSATLLPFGLFTVHFKGYDSLAAFASVSVASLLVGLSFD